MNCRDRLRIEVREEDALRIGVAGTGFGAFHLDVFRQIPGVTLAAVASARAERAEAAAERFGIPVATTDFATLLDACDAVVIATPPALHVDMAIAAAQAGKHIFCEKPMADNLANARRMRDAVDAAGVVGMLNYQQRFTSHFGAAQRMVQAGELGRLIFIEMRVTMNPVDYLHSTLWSDSKTAWFGDAAQGGGLLASSVGPHLLDLVTWLGGPLHDVAARTQVSRTQMTLADGRALADITAEDGFAILGQYANGALLTVRGVPVAHGGNEWTLELHGELGTLQVDGTRLRWQPAGGDGVQDLPGDDPPANPRIAIASTFVEAARAGGPSPSPTFAEALHAQAVLDAALRAARSGRWEVLDALAD